MAISRDRDADSDSGRPVQGRLLDAAEGDS